MASSYTTTYQQYLQAAHPDLSPEALAQVETMLSQTHWEQPETVLDCNNIAVIALIEAEASETPEMREMYLEMAIAALNEGVDHPLCAAHLALVQTLIGARGAAIELAFSNFLASLLPAFSPADAIAPGLIYLPQCWQSYFELAHPLLATLLTVEDGYQQSVLLLGEILAQSQFVFYNATGLRFLQLAAHLSPQLAAQNLNLGISSLMNGQVEGLLHLHRARQQLPTCSPILQSLYLAYSDLGQAEVAEYWRSQAQSNEPTHWASLPSDSPFTYVRFENLRIAVEPSFQSIVTSVLLAKGTWFEQEMEFWQDQIEVGMTVIDVGANVGVYTFSAASRVGATGRVLAVEPFSGCVQCLEETRRVNELEQVRVIRAAASDRDGTVQLALHTASELNQIVPDAPDASIDGMESVPCFTLDTLIERENLQRVDVLKIDAEGHELQVLLGSDRLLRDFKPIILYENIAGSQGDNLPVAEFLMQKNYQLFRYQPFVKQLIPIQSTDELNGSLNIIARLQVNLLQP